MEYNFNIDFSNDSLSDADFSDLIRLDEALYGTSDLTTGDYYDYN